MGMEDFEGMVVWIDRYESSFPGQVHVIRDRTLGGLSCVTMASSVCSFPMTIGQSILNRKYN